MQCGQRLASSGMFVLQNGHCFSVGAGSGCKASAATADAKAACDPAACAAKCGASCTGACKGAKASQASAAAASADMVKKEAMGIAGQVELYPLDTCVVSGEKLGSMGEPFDYDHEGRLVRFCCQGCVGPFQENPAVYLEKLDAAVVAAQSESYPLTTCPVSGIRLSRRTASGNGRALAYPRSPGPR